MEQIRSYTKAELEQRGWQFTTVDDGYETFSVPVAGSEEREALDVKR